MSHKIYIFGNKTNSKETQKIAIPNGRIKCKNEIFIFKDGKITVEDSNGKEKTYNGNVNLTNEQFKLLKLMAGADGNAATLCRNDLQILEDSEKEDLNKKLGLKDRFIKSCSKFGRRGKVKLANKNGKTTEYMKVKFDMFQAEKFYTNKNSNKEIDNETCGKLLKETSDLLGVSEYEHQEFKTDNEAILGAQNHLFGLIRYFEGDPNNNYEGMTSLYKDCAGVETNGFGVTGEDAKKIKTKADAYNKLSEKIFEHAGYVIKILGQDLYNQIPNSIKEALIDLSYNKGPKKITPEIVNDLKNKNYVCVLTRLECNETTDGIVRPGLYKRSLARMILAAKDLTGEDKEVADELIKYYYEEYAEKINKYCTSDDKKLEVRNTFSDLTKIYQAYAYGKINRDAVSTDKSFKYQVKHDDTLIGIARTHCPQGVDEKEFLERLIKYNHGNLKSEKTNYNIVLKPGSWINIPKDFNLQIEKKELKTEDLYQTRINEYDRGYEYAGSIENRDQVVRHVFKPNWKQRNFGDKKLKGKTIIVNAGHGWNSIDKNKAFDCGAQGHKKIEEKIEDEWKLNYNMSMLMIEDLVNQGATVVFLQGDAKRIAEAIKQEPTADLLVSVHMNSTKEVKEKNEMEIIFNCKSDDSRNFAKLVENNFDKLHTDDLSFATTQPDSKGLAVLNASNSKNIPALLWEVGYMSSPNGVSDLNNPEISKINAKTMTHTIAEFLDKEKTHIKTHLIKKGDSLAKIAKNNGITIKQLLIANPDKNENIKVGQVWNIPGKKESLELTA